MLFIDWQPALEIFSIGNFAVRWYSFFWCIGLALAFIIVQKLYKQQQIDSEKFEPLFLYCFFGVLIGARLGHCIFYEPEAYLTSFKGIVEMLLPIRFDASGEWHFAGYSGLASHGGTIGLFLSLMLYVRKTKLKVFQVLDNIAIATPMTACCIRLGNLMNSEIIGNPTDMPWGFYFHTPDAFVDGMLVPRHPAQLYEAIAYFIIFIIGVCVYRKHGLKKSEQSYMSVGTGFYFGFCLATIFLFRFFVEFLKKEQVYFEQGMVLNMGQLLSIPFILVGIYFMFRKAKRA